MIEYINHKLTKRFVQLIFIIPISYLPMRKIRIIEFINRLGFAGSEKTIYAFCNHIDRARFEISLCAFEKDQRFEQDKTFRELGIEVFFSSKEGLRKDLNQLHADIFHIHRGGSSGIGIITAAKDAGIPIVIEHNIFGRLDDSYENELIDCHIFVSYSCASRYQIWTRQPLLSPRYEVLYNPVEIDLYDRYGFDDRDFNKKVIGRIGRDDNTKWDFDFLEALPIIVKEFPDLEFHVIGITPQVYDKLRAVGCEQNLVLHPMTDNEQEIMSFLSNISVFTHFAMVGETFGLAVAEAMAAKLPVVTHYAYAPLGIRDSAQTELVSHGYNGFVALSPQMYANGVITLLSSPEISKQYGLQGHMKAKACYDAPVITRGLEEIFINQAKIKGLAL